jgi:hypothetical protein
MQTLAIRRRTVCALAVEAAYTRRLPMAEMNPLRCRMIEDMKVRNLSPVTQRCYVHAVAKFA